MSEWWPKKKRIYLHKSKEDGYALAEEMGFGENSEAARTLAYLCYEVSVDIEVLHDGTAYATHLNGVALTDKVLV